MPATITQFAITPSTVKETDTATVECIAFGNPAPNIGIIGPNSASVAHTSGRVVLTNVNKNQAGSYTCQASNGIGSPANASSSLFVNCMYFCLVTELLCRCRCGLY